MTQKQEDVVVENARVAIEHPRFRWAERDIFLKRVVADCMTHECRLVQHEGRRKLDACCQYGVDVDTGERDRILEHRAEIAALLVPAAAAQPWFRDEEQADPDFPSGRYVRTSTFGEGCVFLAHDQRGCAIHRASIEGGWDFNGIKPHVCRLFPLSYDSDSLVLSDDYADYSCAGDPAAPSVYRVARDTIAEVFGADLVAALDRAEEEVLGRGQAAARAGLRVVG